MPSFSLRDFAAFSIHYWTSDPTRLAVAVATGVFVLLILGMELAAWRAKQKAAWLAEEIAREKREQQAAIERMLAGAKAHERQRADEARRIHQLNRPHAGGKDAA